MTKISRNWSRLNREERLALAQTIVGKLGQHSVAADPAFEALKEWLGASQKHAAAEKSKESELAQVRRSRETAEDALLVSMEAVADVIERAAIGDPQILSASGFAPEGEPVAEKIPLRQVINFSISAGDFDGELETHWDAVRGATFYNLQICMGDPENEKKWKDFSLTKPLRSMDSAYDPSEEFNRTGVKRTKATLTGLKSGKRVWVRVRAANLEEAGPWSEPRSKLVP